MKEAVIVACGRSAIARSHKGSLKDVRPEEIAAQTLKGVLDSVPSIIDKVEDLVLGCAMPEGKQGANVARYIGAKAGLPNTVGAITINRFCSSGLQAIAIAAHTIMAGQGKIIIAGGLESMTSVPMGGYHNLPDPALMESDPEYYMAMGLTAERVAVDYDISRERQDSFAVESHKRAARAVADGTFKEEIIPIEIDNNGNIFDTDQGVRPDSNLESLSKLRSPFKVGGSVTAATSSQVSDGAAFVVLMEKEEAEKFNLVPLAKFVSFSVAGVPPEVMGIGPIYAIPKALKLAGLTLEDIDLIELNEAFAAQSLACIDTLKLNTDITNVNGGAIALGHPLGATGAILTTKLIHEQKRRGAKYGLVSMCIGGGQGAAAVFELL